MKSIEKEIRVTLVDKIYYHILLNERINFHNFLNVKNVANQNFEAHKNENFLSGNFFDRELI